MTDVGSPETGLTRMMSSLGLRTLSIRPLVDICTVFVPRSGRMREVTRSVPRSSFAGAGGGTGWAGGCWAIAVVPSATPSRKLQSTVWGMRLVRRILSPHGKWRVGASTLDQIRFLLAFRVRVLCERETQALQFPI